MKFTTGDTIATLDKLWYLQRAHAARYTKTGGAGFDLMVQSILDVLEMDALASEKFAKILGGRDASSYIRRAISADARNWISAKSFMEKNAFLFAPLPAEQLQSNVPEPSLGLAQLGGYEGHDGHAMDALVGVRQSLEKLDDSDWSFENIKKTLLGHMETALAPIHDHASSSGMEDGLKATALKSSTMAFYRLFRWAIIGGQHGPSDAMAMEALGRDVTLKRLTAAEKVLKDTANEISLPSREAMGVVSQKM